MGLRAELRKKFSSGKKSSSSRGTGIQQDQATKLHVPTPPREHAGSKHIEPKLPVQLNLADAPIHELWNVAYEKLRQEDAKLIQDYEAKIQEDLTAGSGFILAPSINARERMELVLKNKMDKVKRDAWRLQFGDSEIQIAAILPIFASIASKVNAYISTALTANPPASLAWGGISVLLPLFVNPSEQAGSLAKGLDYVSALIVRGQLREDLYSRRYALEKMADGCWPPGFDHLAYKRALEAQYRNILRFQAETYCHFAKNAAHRFGLDAAKWNDWEVMIDDVRLQEDALAALDNLWHDVQYSQDSLAVKKQHQESLAAWLTISEDVSGLRKAIAEAEKDRDRADLLFWLCQVDPSQMYNAARDKHEAGTSEWLMENQELLAWEKEDKSLLWIHGKAGSGKSILSSSVIKHLDDKYLSDPLTAVAYFYFSFTDSQKQGVDIMLASIIKQILACRPNIPQSALKLKQYKASGKRPDTQTLTTALSDAIFGFSAVYIVIDALDECPTLSGERKKLLKALSTILDKTPENLHLLFTSRKESDISAAMKHHLSRPCSHELDLLACRSTVDDDIGIFIDTIFASDDYKSWPASVKEEARNLLIKKADGMFQYVSCQLDALNDLSTVTEVHEALQSLPDGLGATYDRMLLNINPKFQSRIINSLKWLAFSLFPIQVEWLSEIFTFRAEDTHPPDGTEKLFHASDVMKYFSSLVVVANNIIRLTHFSIKEYLVSTQITGGPAAAFGLVEIDAHLHIATWCLTYHILHADDGVYKRFRLEDRFNKKPDSLDSYTSMQWARHLEMIPSKLWPSEIVQKATSALVAHSKTLAKMISFDTWHFRRENLFLAQPICYTTMLGLSNLTMMLLSNGPETNNFFTQEDIDSALADAAYNGSIGLVHRLLDKGANLQAEEDVVSTSVEHTMRNFSSIKINASALYAAAGGGHLEIVQLLVNKGAEVNASHGIAGSALHAAARGGHLDIVKFLTDRGADIHARLSMEGSVIASSIHPTNDYCFQFLLSKGALKDDGGETALTRAAALGRWDLCYLLIDQGASIHASAPNDIYASPLQAACKSLGHEWKDFTKRVNFVERLLDLGADINAPRGSFGNALQAACQSGEIRLVKMLLDRGADVNARDEFNRDALQYSLSASRDRLDIMKLLLSNGANVNAQSFQGNALHAACNVRCSKDEISLLLEHGVEIHAKGQGFGTVLEAAAAHGHEWLVRELLERGVDVNECGGYHGTALQAAYRLYNSKQAQDMVKLLLEHGADAHAKDGVFGSALTVAAANLRLTNSSIQQLLDLGVDINDCEGIHGTTALQAVLENSTDDTEPTKLLERLQFLFERGADANAGAGLYGFALQSAVMANHKSVRKPLYRNVGLAFLLDNYPDINVNAEGGQYGSALQAAAYAGQPESVKLLIQKGANVNAQGGEYKNALNAATIRGLWDIVMILLDNGAEPDCYRSEKPDEEWLCSIVDKCGRGARERYERVWEMKNPKLDVTN